MSQGNGLFKNTTLIYSFSTFGKNICILVPSSNTLLSSYKLNYDHNLASAVHIGTSQLFSL